MQPVMTGCTEVGLAITHRCKDLDKQHSKVASEDDQEVFGSVLNDSVENARHAASTHTTLTFRRTYDGEEGRAIFRE